MDRVKRAREKKIVEMSDSVDIGDMILKLDEITDWISEHDQIIHPATDK